MSELFTLILLSHVDAEYISRWEYPAPYHVYEWMDWETMVRENRDLADPDLRKKQFRGVHHPQFGLCGFIQLFPMNRVIRLGIGLRPDCCGYGYGKNIMELAVKEAHSAYPDIEMDLEVHCWNLRAIKTYEHAGFQITDTYSRLTHRGEEDFHCMVYQLSSSMR